jgi:hypothetical protein
MGRVEKGSGTGLGSEGTPCAGKKGCIPLAVLVGKGESQT